MLELLPTLVLLALLLPLSWLWPWLWLWPWPPLVLAGLLPALLVPLGLGRRLGGHSGDSYGACVEWVEALALLLSALLLVLLRSAGPAAG